MPNLKPMQRTEAVIVKATHLKPAERYQTIAEMKASLLSRHRPATTARPVDPLSAFIRLLFGRGAP